MDFPTRVLRSPRESLGGYILLPRLIDKVRLHASGQLPHDYTANLLGDEYTLDGRFLAFTGLKAEALRHVIVSSRTDEEVLAWVEVHARPATRQKQRVWAQQIDRYRPDAALVDYRRRMYTDLAARIDVSSLSVLDLIDLDEGRMSL